ncbi:MAG: ABC transporter ATP-binding protein [Planctomycetes bacterium]|nr:ABC transporter ATP-binding protein [Planctomycetota bacterium]
MSVIKTEKLTKTFVSSFRKHKIEAVKNLDLEINKGEVFGLLGPNGSGKSTTAKMLLGLLGQTSGKISVLGYNPDNIQIKSQIGFLPEETYLYRFLNAEETLDFFGKILNIKRKERKIRSDKLLKIVGLLHSKKRPVREYSKGMRRRLGFAQALINDPELLILDEPTSGLDPIGTAEMKQLIVKLKNEGKTILMNSHLLADVEEVCDRISILYKGELLKEGNLKDMLTIGNSTSVEFKRKDEEFQNKLKEFAKKLDVEIARFEVPKDTLSMYFLRLIYEKNPDDLPESLQLMLNKK